ncbi:Uma2 family endonuclease [Nonomuraea pusilla]|uniref:Endonuclease, Uma2 family (Restriction endonuclease fold) n=1 Tax=Nonomuraea pusilla TaxID=46177 RepID=A0A1H8I7V8_9ACTN|nr:Uma2 family endonuclease [Nonomuraea pusilla]SEN64342.1 Endonuclease, Uma2 family (restriction endonuclease fold) [Nonomuraea pusilla]
MTALPEDSWLLNIRPQPALVTAEEYEALPEEIARAIEIVDGYLAYRAAPTPDHQTAGRRLANLLERHARAAMAAGHGCLTVNIDLDLRLRDVPLLNRRPDVALYRCLDRERGERLRAEHVLLVVEIVSPGSETQDTTDKLGEYAKAGIPHYWIVRLDGTGVSIVERYRLDPASMLYKHVGTLMKDEAGGVPEVANPIPMVIHWAELEF